MAEFTLELIAHGPKVDQIVPIAAHVLKYTESFIYTEAIAETSTPIAYYESESLDAWKNIQLIDLTYPIAQNSHELVANDVTWTELTGTSYTSKYKNIAVTNVMVTDSFGRKKPLFYKHILPDNTIEATLHLLTGGNRVDVETGYTFDAAPPAALYTNYQNYFNPDTGAYRLYYIVSTAENDDGEIVTSHDLLNPIPTAEEAEWDDIDLDTGMLTTDYPLYTREKVGGGYTFYFNDGDTWYIKPTIDSTIRAELPTGKEPSDPWFIKFTNGDFSSVQNGALRRYHIPEYDYQPFSPSKPYVFSTYGTMLWVNRNTIASTRRDLAILPGQSMHFTLYVYNEEDELTQVYTTDPDYGAWSSGQTRGARFSDTDVFYNDGVEEPFLSWDNKNGFISLAVEIDPNSTFAASYFYEAKELEYTGLTLNPLQNKNALNYMWVFYMIPDAHDYDKAIHYLAVDKSGKIVYCSQERGRRYPSLQLTNADGSANPDSVIGKKYRSSVDPDTFVTKYTVPYYNEYAYYVLAEVLVMDIGIEEDSIVIDVRRDGATIKDDMFEDAIRVNHRILQSLHGYGENGQEVPKNAVMVIKAPVTLLEEYGGVLTPDRAEALLKSYMPAAVHPVISWEFFEPKFTGYSIEHGKVELSMTWEGPNLTYNIYRRSTPQEEYSLLTTIDSPGEGVIEYTDEDVDVGEVYYYNLRIVSDGIEHPFGSMLSIKVKEDEGDG